MIHGLRISSKKWYLRLDRAVIQSPTRSQAYVDRGASKIELARLSTAHRPPAVGKSANNDGAGEARALSWCTPLGCCSTVTHACFPFHRWPFSLSCHSLRNLPATSFAPGTERQRRHTVSQTANLHPKSSPQRRGRSNCLIPRTGRRPVFKSRVRYCTTTSQSHDSGLLFQPMTPNRENGKPVSKS